MPSSSSPPSVTCEISRWRRTARAPGLIESPHSFGRGNRARSSSATFTPARARTSAAMAPAGPASAITTSCMTEDEGAVLRAETETVAEHRRYLRLSADVRYDVHVALRVGLSVIDRRRQEAVPHRECRGD